MWQTHHCRCAGCRQKHIKMKPIGIKKRTNDQVYIGVVAFIDNLEILRESQKRSYQKGFFWAEEVAESLRVPTHQVKQILHRLNLEGRVSQPKHKAPHDSNRDPWTYGNGDSAWMGDIYYIRKKE